MCFVCERFGIVLTSLRVCNDGDLGGKVPWIVGSVVQGIGCLVRVFLLVFCCF